MPLQLKNILFLDIETISGKPSFEELPSRMQELWIKKAKTFRNTELPPEDLYFERAGIFAEYGQVVCIGVGGFFDVKNMKFKAKIIAEKSEKETLLRLKTILDEHPAKEEIVLCAHNGKEFDFPYLSRRMLINGISLPYCLDNSTKKPWEIFHLDTLEFWKFGDYKHFTSLDLLAAVFDIPTSKSELDGSQVNHTYYIENDLDKINRYCIRDVIVLAQLYLKLNNLPLMEDEQILY
jgi:3'-5' exonuclease